MVRMHGLTVTAWVQALVRELSCKQHTTSTDKRKKERGREGGRGFPGGSVVKNLPASAGDTGSIPGPGRCHMPHATEPLSSCTAPIEPVRNY